MSEYGEPAAPAEDIGPNQLEQRYRRVLRLLPASYREVWEEDMVATFLAGAATDDPEETEYAADFGRPSWGEVASVVALAVRLRIATPAAPPRYQVWGQTLRLVGLVGVLVMAVWAVLGVGIRLWTAGKLGWLLPPPEADFQFPLPTDYRRLVWDFADLLWVGAFAALLLGRWRVARILATLGVLRWVVVVVGSVVETYRLVGTVRVPYVGLYELLHAALLLLALTAFHRDVPRVRPLPWLAALPVWAVLQIVTLAGSPRDSAPALDWAGLHCLALLALAGWQLAGPLFGRAGSAAWARAVAILAAAVLAQRAMALLDYTWSGLPGLGRLTVLAAIEAAAVLAAGVALELRARRLLRALPAPAEDAAAWTGRTR